MHLFFEPVDVWLFRDGRPFNAEADHRAEGMFPPYPTVMQGAIRSHRLVQRGINLQDKQAIISEVGTHDDFGKLRLRGPFLAKREGSAITPYFPLPADVVPQQDSFHPLIPELVPSLHIEGSTYQSSAIYDVILLPSGDPVKATEQMGQWLDQRALKHYLEGKSVTATPTEDLYITESRPGIGMNHTQRVTQQGLLYEVDFIRTHPNVGLYVELHGYDDWHSSGALRMGGESRAARYSEVEVNLLPEWQKARTVLPQHFKVYFAMPTYFSGGMEPLNHDWSQFFDGEVRLRSVAVNRYESIGGYDLAKGDHKPARRYVPAGSVYYFTCEGEVKLKPNPLANTPENFIALTEYGAEIGFGHFFISKWKGV